MYVKIEGEIHHSIVDLPTATNRVQNEASSDINMDDKDHHDPTTGRAIGDRFDQNSGLGAKHWQYV